MMHNGKTQRILDLLPKKLQSWMGQ